MRPIIRSRERTITMGTPANPLDRHVVVDLETTGLSPRHGHRVIEIGAVAVENGAIAEEFSTLIDAGVPIPPEVQAIHGITDEMLEGQPPPEDVMGSAPPTERGNDDVGIQDYFRDHTTASATSSSAIFFSSNCRATRFARPRNGSSRVPAEIFLMTMASGRVD